MKQPKKVIDAIDSDAIKEIMHIVQTAIDKKMQELAREAFQKHFGFDLGKADKDEIQRTFLGDLTQVLTFRGVPFIYFDGVEYDFTEGTGLTVNIKHLYV